VKVYHRSSSTDEAASSPPTDAPEGVIAEGSVVGVWVSTARPARHDGAPREIVELDIPDSLFERYEWARGDRRSRAALIPAPVLSRYGGRSVAPEKTIAPEEPATAEISARAEAPDEPSPPRRRRRSALAVAVAAVAAAVLIAALLTRRRR
jgi:hypothetical protein